MAENLADGLHKELMRNINLLCEYKQIPTGVFGAMVIEQNIDAALDAVLSGDTLRMMAAYEHLKESE